MKTLGKGNSKSSLDLCEVNLLFRQKNGIFFNIKDAKFTKNLWSPGL